MATPRYSKVDPSVTAYYHCVSRCVRRAFLCGKDVESGRDYEHRKQWLIDKINFLTSYFSIQILSYAIMDNHYHIDIYINVAEAQSWSDEEVLIRWKHIFPKSSERAEMFFLSLEDKQKRATLLRERLMDLSWFMRCLNQGIAELANVEDACTGRFWEERFKSQALLDYGAVVASMVYIDLNPIRAKIADTPEESEYTSVQERIIAMKEHIEAKMTVAESSSEIDAKTFQDLCDEAPQPIQLMPFDNERYFDDLFFPTIPMCLSDYLTLVDVTGRIIREDKAGAIPDNLLPILDRLNLSEKGWTMLVKNINKKFFNAVGSCRAMYDFSKHFHKKSPKGIKLSKLCYLSAA